MDVTPINGPRPASGQMRGLVMHSAVYWVGTMVAKFMGFLLIPLYTRHLTPANYGTLELVVLTADVFCMVLSMQLTTAVFKYYHAGRSEADRNKVISTAMIGVAIMLMVALAVLLPLAGAVSTMIFGTTEYRNILRIQFISLFLASLQTVPLSFLRIKEKSVAFVALDLAQVLALISLNVLFIVILDYGVLGAVLSGAIWFSISCPVLATTVLRRTGIGFDGVLVRQMLRYSGPLVPGMVGMFVLHFYDRFFLNHYATLEQVGIYAIAYKFGFLISQVVAYPFDLI